MGRTAGTGVRVGIVGAIAVVALAACQPAPQAMRHDGFQGGPGHQGVTTGGLASDARVRWVYDAGHGNHVGPPIIVGELVIVTVGIAEVPGYPEQSVDQVIAFERRTGKVRWKLLVDDVGLHLAAGGNRLALVSQRAVTSIDLLTGKAIWTTAAPGEVSAAPVVAGGVAYVAATEPRGPSDDGTLTAYDLDDGKLWTVSTTGVDGSAVTPAVAGETVFLGGKCTGVQAFRRSDGARRWMHPGTCIGGGSQGSVVVRDGRVYSTDGRVTGAQQEGAILDAATGRKLGSFETGVTPAVGSENRLSGGGDVLVNRTPDGRTRHWAHRFDRRYLARHPIVAGQRVFVVVKGPDQSIDQRGYLVELDLASGREQRRIDLGPYGNGSEGADQRWLALANGTAATHVFERLVVVY